MVGKVLHHLIRVFAKLTCKSKSFPHVSTSKDGLQVALHKVPMNVTVSAAGPFSVRVKFVAMTIDDMFSKHFNAVIGVTTVCACLLIFQAITTWLPVKNGKVMLIAQVSLEGCTIICHKRANVAFVLLRFTGMLHLQDSELCTDYAHVSPCEFSLAELARAGHSIVLSTSLESQADSILKGSLVIVSHVVSVSST